MKGTEKQIKYAQDIIETAIKNIREDAASFIESFPSFVTDEFLADTENAIACLKAIAESDHPAARIIYHKDRLCYNPDMLVQDMSCYEFKAKYYALSSL